MTGISRTVTWVLWLAAALPRSGNPQALPGTGMSVGLSAVWEESSLPASVIRRSGTVFDARARASAWKVDLDVGYRQGSLGAQTGTGDRDLVEGSVMLGVRPARWLKLEGGPRIRAYVTPTATERWILWEGRAQFAAQLAGPSVRSFVTLGHTFSASLGSALAFGRAQAGEAGVTVKLGDAPLWGQLSYWVSHINLSGGQRTETMQGIAVAIAVTR